MNHFAYLLILLIIASASATPGEVKDVQGICTQAHCPKASASDRIDDKVALLQTKLTVTQRQSMNSSTKPSCIGCCGGGGDTELRTSCLFVAPNNQCENVVHDGGSCHESAWYDTSTGQRYRCFNGRSANTACRFSSSGVGGGWFGCKEECPPRIWNGNHFEVTYDPETNLEQPDHEPRNYIPGSQPLPLGVIQQKCLTHTSDGQPVVPDWRHHDNYQANFVGALFNEGWNPENSPVAFVGQWRQDAIDKLARDEGYLEATQGYASADAYAQHVVDEQRSLMTAVREKLEQAGHSGDEEKKQFFLRKLRTMQDPETLYASAKGRFLTRSYPKRQIEVLQRQIDVYETLYADLSRYAEDLPMQNYRWNQWAEVCGMDTGGQAVTLGSTAAAVPGVDNGWETDSDSE